MARPTRVVLTGGPGAGKTAVLEVLRRQMCEHVELLPEAASILFGGGFPRRSSDAARRASQLAIFRVQEQLEAVGDADTPTGLVVCDRGLVDGLAYWPAGGVDFFSAVGVGREALYARYDAVVHLRVPPPDGGYDHRNPVRTETPEQARALDERLLEAWSGHPNRTVVDNAADFRTKLERALDVITRYAPRCGHASR